MWMETEVARAMYALIFVLVVSMTASSGRDGEEKEDAGLHGRTISSFEAKQEGRHNEANMHL